MSEDISSGKIRALLTINRLWLLCFLIKNSWSASQDCHFQASFMHKRIEWLWATIALVPFWVKFSSMSESTQTSQADLCYVKRCSCVFFFLKARRKDLTYRHESLLPPPLPLCPWMMLKNLSSFLACRTGCPLSRLSKFSNFSGGRSNGGGGGGGGGGRGKTLVCRVFSPCFLGKNNTGTSFHITRVSLQSLGGFWHTWTFQLKWRLRDCCPEPFNWCRIRCYEVKCCI